MILALRGIGIYPRSLKSQALLPLLVVLDGRTTIGGFVPSKTVLVRSGRRLGFGQAWAKDGASR
jgi:hypothetical protein